MVIYLYPQLLRAQSGWSRHLTSFPTPYTACLLPRSPPSASCKPHPLLLNALFYQPSQASLMNDMLHLFVLRRLSGYGDIFDLHRHPSHQIDHTMCVW